MTGLLTTLRFVNGLADAEYLSELSVDESAAAGERAAAQIVAGLRWSSAVGERLDTRAVGDLLGISRQALAKRQRSGSLLGLPGQSTTWFPTWQFDIEGRSVRPEVRQLIGAFRDRLDDEFDPMVVATWASTDQATDLDGSSPARWIREGRDADRLLVAADRAAVRLAQMTDLAGFPERDGAATETLFSRPSRAKPPRMVLQQRRLALRPTDLTDRSVVGDFGLTADVCVGADHGPAQRFSAAAFEAGFDGIRHRIRHDPSMALEGIAMFGQPGEQPDRFSSLKTDVLPDWLIDSAWVLYGIEVVPDAPLP